MLRWMQNFPHLLEMMWQFFEVGLLPLKRLFKPVGFLEPTILVVEKAGKGAVFNCQMCGQCILHSTGMTCPMNCPKNLRNGPCGGVRQNGHCEVKPEMKCVWVEAYERSLKMPIYGNHLADLQPPLNRQLENSSSWINMFNEIDTDYPEGWVATKDIPVNIHLEGFYASAK